MQCEGPHSRKEEIKDGSEINRGLLTEDTRAQDITMLFLNISLKATSTLQDYFRGESAWKSRREVLATPLHTLNPAGYLACSTFYSNSELADLAPPDRPGPGE